MFRQAVLALAALAAFTSAQTNGSDADCCSNGLNYTTSGPLQINASQIPLQTRAQWCLAQHNSCPELCGGYASNNTCSDTDLSYTCTCTSGNQPNISDYDQTIPSLVCQQWKANCVLNHPNDALSQAACQSVTCGQKNASAVEGASSSASSGASSSATATGASSTGSHTTTGSASGTAATASATSSGAAVMALQVGQNYGTGILGALVLAVFGLAL